VRSNTGPYVVFDPIDILARQPYCIMDNKALGLMFRQVTIDLKDGNFAKVLADFPIAHRCGGGRNERARPTIPASVRQSVLSVGVCALCRSTERLSVDHIIPFSKGGADTRDNFQCLCKPCNSRKGARL
jgi:hypothetical protein